MYKIIEAGDKESFEKEMGKYIYDGFIPVGDVSVEKTCRVRQSVGGQDLSIYDYVYRQGVSKKPTQGDA